MKGSSRLSWSTLTPPILTNKKYYVVLPQKVPAEKLFSLFYMHITLTILFPPIINNISDCKHRRNLFYFILLFFYSLKYLKKYLASNSNRLGVRIFAFKKKYMNSGTEKIICCVLYVQLYLSFFENFKKW